jgi:hypothetical protein
MDKDIYDLFDAQLKKVDPTVFRSYRVARYTISHKQLTILVEAENSSSDALRQRRFITFEAVEYMQLYPSWKDAPFKLALPSEQNLYLEKAKINIEPDSAYLVCYALPFEKQIFVVCGSLSVTEEMPKLYEYTF